MKVEEMNELLKQLKRDLDTSNRKAENLEQELKEIKDRDGARDKKQKEEDHTKDGVQPLKQLDRKDVEKPEKYGGNPDQWLKWSKSFKKFIRRHDARWAPLLEIVEKNSGKPVTTELEETWAKELNIVGIMKDFKDHLNEYLECYTSGTAKVLVEACGDRKSLDAWRQLADKGHSMRAAHVHALRRKAFFPKSGVAAKDLENAISTWETDIELFEAATVGEKMPEPNRHMSLIDMCPEGLRKHLKALEHVKTIDYEGLKIEISDWLADQDNNKTQSAKALQGSEQAPDQGDEDWNFDDCDATTSHAELLALVKNKFSRKGKGRGKDPAPGGAAARDAPADHSGKVCYDCGEPGHIGADCPQRKARMAAGGPARLPKGGKGKGGKGAGKWQPNKAMWKSWFPGPTQAQWTSWFPNKGEGKGDGTANHLASLSATKDTSWLWQPGYCFSLVQKTPVATKNPFEALAQEENTVVDEQVQVSNDENEVTPDLVPSSDEEEAVPAPPPCHCCSDATKCGISTRATRSKSFRQQRRQKMYDDLLAKDEAETDEKMERLIKGEITPNEYLEDVTKQVNKDPMGHAPAASATSLRRGIKSTPAPGQPEQVVSMFDRHFPRLEAWTQVESRKERRARTNAKQTLAPLIEKRPQGLNQLQDNGAWEYFEAILDSGASVTVVPPWLGKGYDVMEGEAARLGVKYEIANGEEIPNLGEKLMPVVTAEGTTRGLRAQVAEVSKPLQAVRSLVRTGHMVIFGDGDEGNEHYIMNKMTGECNRVKDDGTNYLMGMYIVPKAEMQAAAGFTRPVKQP